MTFDIDRTDHNRLATAWLRQQAEAAEPATNPAAATPKTIVRVETLKVVSALLPLEIIDCEQNSPEWHHARLGIPTASNFDAILTPAKTKSSEAMPDGSFPIRTEDDLKSAIEAHASSKKKVTLKRHIVSRAAAIDALDMLPDGWDDGSEKKSTKAEQQTRRTYMLKLAGELLTGIPIDMVMTRDMERGHLMEPEARDLYRLLTGAELERVGFLKRGRVGCSPDCLIGDDGGLEIKTTLPHLLLDMILKDEFPEQHKAQVQGALWLTGRKWWDLEVVGCVEIDGRPTLAPNIPPFIKRATRDEPYIAQLAAEIERFNTDLDAIVAQMQRRMETIPDLIAA